MDSDSLARKCADVEAMSRSRDTSAQLARNNGDAARLVYQLGLQMLLSGDPVKAARCFQEVSRVFCDWPLLWLRLAECCILTHQQQQEEERYYNEKQKEEQDDHRKQQQRSDNQKQQGSLRSSSMTVTVMSGGRNEDTWQYVLLPAGTRGDGSEVKSETGVHAESTVRSFTVKSTALDGAGAGASTALSGLADLMAKRVRGEAGPGPHSDSGKQEASSANPPRHHVGTAAGSSSSTSSGGTTSDATVSTDRAGSGHSKQPLPFSLSLPSSLGLEPLPLARMCLKNAIRLLLSHPPHTSAASTVNSSTTSSSTSSGSSSSSQKPFTPPPLLPSAHRRLLLSALCQLAWVELSLLNHLACLATAQHALSLLNTRNNPPPHTANDPRTQLTSQKPVSPDRSSDPWQRSALRMFAAEALWSAGGASGAAAAAGGAAGAAAAGRGGKWREWRESVYVNLAALHAMKGDLAEARVCADKARGRGREGGKGVAGGEEFTCAGGMALVVQAYLELRETLDAHGYEKAGLQHDRGVNAGRWEERCDAALRLLQQSNMVCFRMCNGNGMGA
ncbi:unnamed protein product [Closterium sp. Naga37s-1]|nr:unnamed protein product [Closterium sp. Naga37s-1]